MRGWCCSTLTGRWWIPGAGAARRSSAGLARHFRFGGFGDEHAERTEIARAALAAAQAAGLDAGAGEIILVGDTPWDVAAGQALGIPVIGVATGRFGAAELRAAGAALTVADFSDVDGLMGWLETGREQ